MLIEPEAGRKYFYYYPQAVVVVGVLYDGKVNFMPCAWNTGLSYDPFMYGVSVGTERYTHGLLEKADAFSINFFTYDELKLVRSLGRSSGKDIGKAETFDMPYSPGEKVNAPVVVGAYHTMECEKTSEVTFGDHTLVVGEVKLMHVRDDLADQEILNIDCVSPLMYLGVDHYVTLDNDSVTSLKDEPFHYQENKISR